MLRPQSHPYLADMGAPCVLASPRPARPAGEASLRNDLYVNRIEFAERVNVEVYVPALAGVVV
jgi:hypothetical protein